MKTFGLTGGMGMGKSTGAELLRQRGVAVIDTDDLARELTQPGRPALAEIAAAFGPSVLTSSGELRRQVLADLVFNNPQARQRLEAILHPKIAETWAAQLDGWRADGMARAVVVIPLLFETHVEAAFDTTVCVACSRATQLRRLGDRGWAPAEIDRREAAQWPVEQKLARARFVIWTEGTLAVYAAQWERVLAAC
ncbi:MAG TPA: dephospho-CoA kinase [Verrucomicrobiae bacterium]|nr:dephospho-CoA kinase [Verrucomicrobiae bacterium]